MSKAKGLIPVFLVVMVSLFFTGLASTQQWAKTYGGAGLEGATSIRETSLSTASPRPGAASAALAQAGTASPTLEDRARRKILESYGRMPLSFIENQGQADERIAYYIQSPGRSLYFTKDGHALHLTQGKGEDAKSHSIKVELVNATAERIESLEHAPGTRPRHRELLQGPQGTVEDRHPHPRQDRLCPALAGD